MNKNKSIILKFYKNLLLEYGCGIDGFAHLMISSRIGRVELVTVGDWGEYGFDGDFDSIEIERIPQHYPQKVLEYFEKHIWFSQHVLTNVFVFIIPVQNFNSYLIGVSGIAGDAYDNSGHFVEIFDDTGEFLDSATLDDGGIDEWLHRPICGQDFNVKSLEQENRLTQSNNIQKIWSEHLAVRQENSGNVDRFIMIEPE